MRCGQRWIMRIGMPYAAAFLQAAGASAQSRPELVPPIDDVDLARCAEILQLSEAQVLFLRSQHQEYLSHRQLTFGLQIEAYSEARRRANAVGLTVHDVSMREAFEEPTRLEGQLNPNLIAFDEELYQSLVPMLAEHQVARLPRARHARLRRLYRPGDVLERGVELIDLLTPVSADEERRLADAAEMMAHPPPRRKTLPLTADEANAVEPLIDTFEPLVIGARKRLRDVSRSNRSNSLERSDIRIWLRDNNLTWSERPDLEARHEALRREFVTATQRPAQRLAAINRQFLIELQRVLPVQKAEELERLYLEEAYPWVYPDASAAHGLYDEVLAMAELNHAQRDAITSRLAEYKIRHALVSREMAESIERRMSRWLWIEHPDGVDGGVNEEWERLRELGLERIELNRIQTARITEFLTPGQIEVMPKWEYVDREPPRPWDPAYRPAAANG